MRRTSVVTAILVLVLAISGSWYTAQAQGSYELAGAWLVTSRTSPDGEVDSSPQRGLYVFTGSGHYSIMFVNGDEPRAQFSDEGTFGRPTDAEKLAARRKPVDSKVKVKLESECDALERMESERGSTVEVMCNGN